MADPLIIIEKVESRDTSAGVLDPSVELVYTLIGSEEDDEVRSLIEETLPAFYTSGSQTVAFQSYSFKHIGGGVSEATAKYGKINPAAPVETFEIGGHTQKIQKSISVPSYALPGQTAPDWGGAIGVSKGRVEGVDINVPTFDFTVKQFIPMGQLTTAYKVALADAAWTTNGSEFRGYAAGEVLFKGVSGGQFSQEFAELTFKFSRSPNLTAPFDFCGITVTADKMGWEYIEAIFSDAVSNNYMIQKAIAVYVHMVYDESSFDILGIGS